MVPELERLIQAHQNIVFFGGAGVSTESGIPDFRSVDGLYHQKFKYPPETMLSHTFYEQHTAEFLISTAKSSLRMGPSLMLPTCGWPNWSGKVN